jgi:hypothetical protein
MRLVPLALATGCAVAAWSCALAEEPPGDASPSGAPAAAGVAAPDAPAPPAPGGPPAPPAGELLDAHPTPAGPDGRFGALVDVGLPEGVAVSAAFRPVPMVRLFAGPAWNYLAFGIQGGVSVAPWRLAVTPVLTAEVGRYFGANASFLARGGQGVPSELSPLLKDMSYTYGAIHAGIELGSQRGLSFAFDVGLGYVALDAKGAVTKTDSSGATATFRDPRVRATLPSVKLGFHYWF